MLIQITKLLGLIRTENSAEKVIILQVLQSPFVALRPPTTDHSPKSSIIREVGLTLPFTCNRQPTLQTSGIHKLRGSCGHISIHNYAEGKWPKQQWFVPLPCDAFLEFTKALGGRPLDAAHNSEQGSNFLLDLSATFYSHFSRKTLFVLSLQKADQELLPQRSKTAERQTTIEAITCRHPALRTCRYRRTEAPEISSHITQQRIKLDYDFPLMKGWRRASSIQCRG